MKKTSYTSLATRLSLYTILFIALIFSIVVAVFYTNSRERIITHTITHTHSMLDNMANQINSQLSIIETAVDNTAWMLERNISNPDSLSKFLISMINNNPLVFGSSIAFEPNYYPEKGEYFMLYASRNGASRNSNTISCSQIGSKEYYYFGMDWYIIPKLLKKAHWNDPYFDEGGGDIIMTTFSYPLYDEKGEVFAIFTADISLTEFTKFIDKLELYESSYSILLSKHGYYLTHQLKPERILNETLFTLAFEKNHLGYEQIGKEMIAGKTGTQLFDHEGGVSYAFYTAIPNIGWSVCHVCRKHFILKALDATLRNILIIFGIGAILLFIIIFLLIKRQLLPLKGFAQSAQEIATGHFDVILPQIKSKDEMLVLRNSFEHMQKSLNNYMIELQTTTAANERIESELHIAREIQMGMIPKIFPPFPERADVDLHAILKPAKEVGGDLFDFFIQEEKLYFAIGDVSGKGIPASLFMAVTRSLFRTISMTDTTPKQIVTRMNNSISDQNESGMFVTLFVGILDLLTGRLSFCNAGHNNPILIYPDGKIEYMEMETNISVGIMEDFDFIEEEIVLEQGTKLFTYTDGVVEAENSRSDLYSEESLIDLLASHTKTGVKAMVSIVIESVAEHVQEAEQSDDLTILVINYKKQLQKSILMEKELKMINDLQEINRLEVFIEELGIQLDLSPDIVMEIRLALEEAVVNVISYAYPSNEKKEIRLYASCNESELTFLLTDSGKAFDPTLIEEVDITLGIDERTVGGLGMFLVQQIMNEVSYQRIGGENHLTLKKRTT